LTEASAVFFRDIGLDLDDTARSPGGRAFCRPCLDWSERRPHLGGRMGAALAPRCFALGWIRRRDGSRAVSVTPAGWRGARDTFGV
jgi:hypothetical protein